jgi:hypothetical protein
MLNSDQNTDPDSYRECPSLLLLVNLQGAMILR